MIEEKYFKTTSFYLGAFLLAKGLEIIGMNKIEDNKVEFIFKDQVMANFLKEKYNFGKNNEKEVLVDARILVLSIKTLKEKLYQFLFNK